MITLRNITKSFDGKILFHIDDISFPAKGLIIIKGENGCGKTTLFNMLSLIDTSYEGDILYDGKNLKQSKEKTRTRFRKDNIVYVLQKQNMVSFLSIERNQNLYSKEKPKTNTPIHQYSQGQQQKAILDSALNQNKKIFLLDEVLSSLDTENRKTVIGKIKELSNHCLVILVSHDVSLIDLASSVFLLENHTLTCIRKSEEEEKPEQESGHSFSINKGSIFSRFLWNLKSKTFLNTICFTLLFTLVYISLYALRNDCFFYLLDGIRNSEYITVDSTNFFDNDRLMESYADQSFVCADYNVPLVYSDKAEKSDTAYCTNKTYEEYLEKSKDSQNGKLIVDGRLVVSNNETYPIIKDDSFPDGLFFKRKTENDPTNIALLEYYFYYATDKKSIKEMMSEISFPVLLISSTRFVRQNPEYKDYDFQENTFYVLDERYYSSEKISDFYFLPSHSKNASFQLNYNEFFPSGVDCVYLGPKEDGTIVLADTTIRKILREYQKHTRIAYLTDRNQSSLAWYLYKNSLHVNAPYKNKKVESIFKTVYQNTSTYSNSVYSYSLMLYFFLLISLFIELIYYDYILKKHRHDFLLLYSSGMSRKSLFLHSYLPLLLSLSVSFLLSGLLALIQSKGMTFFLFGIPLTLLYLALDFLLSFVLYRKETKKQR